MKASDWENLKSAEYQPESFKTEGFIHLCTTEQLPGVLNRHFKGEKDLLALKLRIPPVDPSLRYEDLYNQGEEFPHLYRPVRLEEVVGLLNC